MSTECDLDQLFEKKWFEPVQALECALKEIGNAEPPDNGEGTDGAHPVEPTRLARCHLLAFRANLELFRSASNPTDRDALHRAGLEHYEKALELDPTLALFDPEYLIDSVIGVSEVAYVFKVYRRAVHDQRKSRESSLDVAHKEETPFALKVLKYRYELDQDAVRRFAEKVGTLQAEELMKEDSHVAKVYDVYYPAMSKAPYNIYYRVRYVDGEPLPSYSNRLKEAQGEQAKVHCYINIADIALQVAKGMKHAHDLDVCHLDLKPANALLSHHDRQGERTPDVVLVDFQYLVLQLAGLPLRGVTVLENTITFLAPEVIHNIDQGNRTSDVYSFGKLVVYLFEDGCDSRKVHVCLERLAGESPRLAVLLLACIDPKPIMRPPEFDRIVDVLIDTRKGLDDRLESVSEQQDLKLGTTDAFSIAQFVIDLWKCVFGTKTKQRVELKVGILVFGLLQALLLSLAARVFAAPTKGWFIPVDGTILPALLVGESYAWLGYSYFRNVTYPFRFWGSRFAEWVRRCMCAWYAVFLAFGVLHPSTWAFCAAVGMTGVTIHNFVMWNYCKKCSNYSEDFFVTRRAVQALVVRGWATNALIGTMALYGIGGFVLWIRARIASPSSVCIAELLLGALVLGANIRLLMFATTGDDAKVVSSNMNLECEIRRWNEAVEAKSRALDDGRP